MNKVAGVGGLDSELACVVGLDELAGGLHMQLRVVGGAGELWDTVCSKMAVHSTKRFTEFAGLQHKQETNYHNQYETTVKF